MGKIIAALRPLGLACACGLVLWSAPVLAADSVAGCSAAWDTWRKNDTESTAGACVRACDEVARVAYRKRLSRCAESLGSHKARREIARQAADTAAAEKAAAEKAAAEKAAAEKAAAEKAAADKAAADKAAADKAAADKAAADKAAAEKAAEKAARTKARRRARRKAARRAAAKREREERDERKAEEARREAEQKHLEEVHEQVFQEQLRRAAEARERATAREQRARQRAEQPPPVRSTGRAGESHRAAAAIRILVAEGAVISTQESLRSSLGLEVGGDLDLDWLRPEAALVFALEAPTTVALAAGARWPLGAAYLRTTPRLMLGPFIGPGLLLGAGADWPVSGRWRLTTEAGATFWIGSGGVSQAGLLEGRVGFTHAF